MFEDILQHIQEGHFGVSNGESDIDFIFRLGFVFEDLFWHTLEGNFSAIKAESNI